MLVVSIVLWPVYIAGIQILAGQTSAGDRIGLIAALNEAVKYWPRVFVLWIFVFVVFGLLTLFAIVIALMILASSGGAWKRIARPSKMSATRLLRSFILLLIFFGAILVGSTRWVRFRDAAFGFLGMPSMRAWSRVTAAIDSPVALITWLAVLYAGYFLFYYLSSTRDPFRA